MERISARRHQVQDAVEPPRGPWDFECGSGDEAEGAKAGDQADEQPLVAPIVGNVQEDVLSGVALGDLSGSASAPPHRGVLHSPFVQARQGVGDHLVELTVSLGRDAEDACGRGRRRVRRCNHRAWS